MDTTLWTTEEVTYGGKCLILDWHNSVTVGLINGGQYYSEEFCHYTPLMPDPLFTLEELTSV